MSRHPLLIWGSAHDPHLRPVALQLEARGAEVFFLEPLGSIDLTLSLTTGPPGYGLRARRLDGDLHTIERPFLLWLRNKVRRNVIRNERDQSVAFALWERGAFVEALIEAYSIRHFNDLQRMRRHANKPLQLKIAQEIGFRCPPTIVSNVKDEILAFARIHESVIVKPLRRAFVPPSIDCAAPARTIFANSITVDDIAAADSQSFRSAPMIIQEEVKKQKEIRLIVFGNSAVTYSIDSQKSEKGSIDWRRSSNENIFQKIVNNKKICDLAIRYLKYIGLNYGVFDIIITPQNEYVFLECNSDGQWAWLESKDDKKSITNMFVKEINTLIENF